MELILANRTLRQPAPVQVTGGDCGACVVGGLMGCSVAQAYALQGETRPFTYYGVLNALKAGAADIITEVPEARVPISQKTWGRPGWLSAYEWFEHVHRNMRRGYYGICQVDYLRRGPLFDHNHWVMLSGGKTVLTPVPVGDLIGQRQDQMVMVSCSVDGERWVEVAEFLRLSGGFNVILARPCDNQGGGNRYEIQR